ncbi:ferredoxin, partial [Klebsiella pneumoniae]|nr:ferredoxin [Klebsiella pneumoniae]
MNPATVSSDVAGPYGGTSSDRGDGQGKEGAVRVIVDRDRCEGNAVCLGIAPDIFDLDDEDYTTTRLLPQIHRPS